MSRISRALRLKAALRPSAVASRLANAEALGLRLVAFDERKCYNRNRVLLFNFVEDSRPVSEDSNSNLQKENAQLKKEIRSLKLASDGSKTMGFVNLVSRYLIVGRNVSESTENLIRTYKLDPLAVHDKEIAEVVSSFAKRLVWVYLFWAVVAARYAGPKEHAKQLSLVLGSQRGRIKVVLADEILRFYRKSLAQCTDNAIDI